MFLFEYEIHFINGWVWSLKCSYSNGDTFILIHLFQLTKSFVDYEYTNSYVLLPRIILATNVKLSPFTYFTEYDEICEEFIAHTKKFCSKISHDINRDQEENASWELAQGEIMFINGSTGVSAILLWPNRLTGPKRKHFSVLEVVPCGGESG